ncbi:MULTISPECIES: NUDIX domain-containing protein [unclassified Actinotalea]|uniref:NUDIX hydrolase n=1 Tax=unclassified Actinotalea TaxID=2638618 RepID=UPI0015F6191A|nr:MULTISPECIES: NUDIX domain-containing protein [unclassified Actinotalea]
MSAPERTLLVAAAYVALRRRDKVLLQLRQGTGYMDGYWCLLAGHVDLGESVVDAAVREVREESGVRVAAEDLEPLTTLHRFEPGGPPVEQRCDVFFEAWRWSGSPRLAEPDKASAMAWFPLDALPDVVPHERLVLDHLARGTRPPALLVVRLDPPPDRYPSPAAPS